VEAGSSQCELNPIEMWTPSAIAGRVGAVKMKDEAAFTCPVLELSHLKLTIYLIRQPVRKPFQIAFSAG